MGIKVQRKDRITTKLKSRRGESIAEVLVAVLIVALSSIMLLTMVQSSSKIVEDSEAGMKKIYDRESQVNKADWSSVGGGSDGIQTKNNVAVEMSYNNGVVSGLTSVAGKPVSGYKVNILYDSYSGIVSFRSASAKADSTSDKTTGAGS